MLSIPHTPINVLLAEDDNDDRYFFEKALEATAVTYNFQSVKDGEQLMEYLFQNIASLPDVIFLDLNMPRKNGHECLAEIKANSKLKGIPVVIFSTSLRQETADDLYDMGAHYYLHKCDYPLLVQCLKRLVALLGSNPKQPPKDAFILCAKQIQS